MVELLEPDPLDDVAGAAGADAVVEARLEEEEEELPVEEAAEEVEEEAALLAVLACLTSRGDAEAAIEEIIAAVRRGRNFILRIYGGKQWRGKRRVNLVTLFCVYMVLMA